MSVEGDQHVQTPEGEDEDAMGAGSTKETLGLTPAEKRILKSTWNSVRKDLGKNGIALFTIFLRDYPNHAVYFKHFKDTTQEGLKIDPIVKIHGIRVLREVSLIVDNLENPETVLLMLRQNAQKHKVHKISRKAYEDLSLSFVKMVENHMGEEKVSAEARATWTKALKIIFTVIVDLSREET
ncbi:PREDICTED: globin-like [Nicrophorus vespilloides]|uniref:Globin-like n=1 Tax=Nicrophorus vespilloides TaxID=110193 RepID=A0ABM1N1V0_NICVS|nr:PREDICTED: globin-like [Nicrophorus vespilloides]